MRTVPGTPIIFATSTPILSSSYWPHATPWARLSTSWSSRTLASPLPTSAAWVGRSAIARLEGAALDPLQPAEDPLLDHRRQDLVRALGDVVAALLLRLHLRLLPHPVQQDADPLHQHVRRRLGDDLRPHQAGSAEVVVVLLGEGRIDRAGVDGLALGAAGDLDAVAL